MKFQNSKLLILAMLIPFLVLFFESNAFAYLDPGTGAFVLQFFLAGIFGALFAIKLYWRKLKSFFSSIFKSKTD